MATKAENIAALTQILAILESQTFSKPFPDNSEDPENGEWLDDLDPEEMDCLAEMYHYTKEAISLFNRRVV
jgi:hypothetical protein